VYYSLPGTYVTIATVGDNNMFNSVTGRNLEMRKLEPSAPSAMNRSQTLLSPSFFYPVGHLTTKIIA